MCMCISTLTLLLTPCEDPQAHIAIAYTWCNTSTVSRAAHSHTASDCIASLSEQHRHCCCFSSLHMHLTPPSQPSPPPHVCPCVSVIIRETLHVCRCMSTLTLSLTNCEDPPAHIAIAYTWCTTSTSICMSSTLPFKKDDFWWALLLWCYDSVAARC